MAEQEARDIATDVIRPCGLLGHLVGRGTWWPSAAALDEAKHAIAQVMGSAYHFLFPVWARYPSLDPGQVPDALTLAGGRTAREDKPEDIRSLLLEVSQEVKRARIRLEGLFPDER